MDIPKSVMAIGDSVFDGCRALKSIRISEGVTSIGDYAFKLCSALESIDIPNSVTSIGKAAFCELSINSLFIPDGTLLDRCAICKCLELTSIEVAFSHSLYRSIDGVLYSRDVRTLLKYPNGREEDYKVAFETEIIGMGAFCCSQVKVVYLNNAIKEIGDRAFNHCRIKELHICNEHPERLVIGKDAFNGLNRCSLYVPIGTGYAYRHDERFKVFKEVIIERQEFV